MEAFSVYEIVLVYLFCDVVDPHPDPYVFCLPDPHPDPLVKVRILLRGKTLISTVL
jgi:hypothetical protein